MFYKSVNLNKHGEMIAFLKKHFRYHTMSSWNKSTSYANNIKLSHVDKPDKVNSETWWGMFELTQWQEKLSDLLEAFGESHNWHWQAGINGRSGGYVVLYSGGQKPSGYKSCCTSCGQKNFHTTEETGVVCGRCHNLTRINFTKPHVETYTTPGIGIDQGEDFDGWSMDSLQERVKLVQDFDRLADDILAAYIGLCSNHTIEDEEVTVTKKVRVLKERTES